MPRPTLRTVLYSQLVALVSAIAVTAGGIVFTNNESRENDRRWCNALISIDDAYSSANVVTEAGRRVALEFRNLRSEFGC